MGLARIVAAFGICLAASPGTSELKGRVIDVTGAAVGGASIELRHEGDSTVVKTAHVDRLGEFHFAGLTADRYQVSVIARGFAITELTRSVGEGEILSLGDVLVQLYSCPDSWELPTIVLRKTPNGTELMGKAEEPGGAPLHDVSVSLEGTGHSYLISGGPDGVFHFSGVEPGLYTLHVVKDGFTDFVIDEVSIRDGYATEVLEWLQLPRCPTNVDCRAARKVLKSSICM